MATISANAFANATDYTSTALILIGAAGLPGIEKLEGHKNYDNCKFQIRMVLIDCGLWKCVIDEDQDVDRDSRFSSQNLPRCKAGMRESHS